MAEDRIRTQVNCQDSLDDRPFAWFDLSTVPQGDDVPPSASLSPIGRAGGYEMLFELASGGMASVYLARASDGRDQLPLVALKRPHRHLASDKVFLSMIVDEARLASAIKHPNVVQVRELGFEAGEPFIVLDYVEGTSLSELRKELAAQERALDSRAALRVALDALAGLHAAHVLADENGKPLGIIHRDVSPHNVLVGCDGRARITDFGIAKAEDRVQVTRTHEVKGKLAYLAPERIDRRRVCTVQSDVFSMAVVLWECLAGRRLFRGEEALDTLEEVMKAPIPTLRQLGSNLSPALDDVIARALSRDLDVRYKTALDFSVALERAAGRGGVGGPQDVTRVVEAVFGPKLRVRHDMLRRVVGEEEAERLLRVSSLPSRRPVAGDASLSNRLAIAAVAPAAPSARYALGGLSASPAPKRHAPKGMASVVLGAGAGIVVGAIAVWFIVRHGATQQAPTPSAPTAIAATQAPLLPPRHVVVHLPFLATGASLDGVDHPIDPPADSFAVDVSPEASTRHRLTATGVDGTRAEGTAREEGGEAFLEQEGLVYVTADPTPAPQVATPAALPTTPRATPARTSKPAPPVGTVRDGFTKLR